MSDTKKKTFRLQNIKAKLNEAFDREINEAKRNEALEEVSNLSFFKLMDIFNESLPSLMEDTNGKKTIKSFVKTIKASKPLAKAYNINRLVKEGKNISSPDSFANLCSIELSEIDGKTLCNESKKIGDIVRGIVDESGIPHEQIEKAIGDTDTPLNEALGYMALNTRNNRNMIDWSNKVVILSENMSRSKNSDIVEEGKTVKDIMNELEEMVNDRERPKWERDVLFEITSAMVSGNSLKEVFDNTRDNCIQTIDKACESNTMEEKTRLCEMKTKLNAKEYHSSTVFEDVLNMAELTHIISESK